MQVQCERCHRVKPCKFYGHPSEVESDAAQNGEWLCKECVPLRMAELDRAIMTMKRYLSRGNTGVDDAEGQ